MAEADLYLEMDESVLNEALAAGWQSGLASMKGVFSFAGKVPENLKPYAEVSWRLTLNGEPLLDFRMPGTLYVRVDAEVELLVMKHLPLKFDVAIGVACGVAVNVMLETIHFDPVQAGDILVLNERRMAASVYFLGTERADLIPARPKSTAPVYCCLQQTMLHRIYDFWWEKTEWKKPIPFSGSLPLNANAFLEKGTNILTRAVTLGLLQRDIRMQDIRLAYSGNVSFAAKPEFVLSSPNLASVTGLDLLVELDVKVLAGVDDTVYLDTSGFVPDSWTPWNDDVRLSNKKENRELVHLFEKLELNTTNAAATLTIAQGSALALKLKDADFNLDFGDKWYEALPENLVNGLIKLFNKKIIESIPPFILAPAALLKDLKIKGMTPEIIPELLSFHDESIEIGLGAEIRKMAAKVPVPGYVANERSRKVHRVDCAVVGDIRPEHRTGYFVLHEALRDGYAACKGCLKGAGIHGSRAIHRLHASRRRGKPGSHEAVHEAPHHGYAVGRTGNAF